jgi:hypothetical protein
VMERLAQIDEDLAKRQNLYEEAAGAWFTAQREIKKQGAIALLSSEHASVTEKKAEADIAALACEGAERESEYVALKAAISVLETRATIGMSLLKAMGRA